MCTAANQLLLVYQFVCLAFGRDLFIQSTMFPVLENADPSLVIADPILMIV